MRRGKIILAILWSAFFAFGPATSSANFASFMVNGGSGLPVQGVAQLNLGTNELYNDIFLNRWKSANWNLPITPTLIPATDLDQYGYPITSLPVNFGASIAISAVDGSTNTFVLKWPSTRAITVVLNGYTFTVTSCFTALVNGSTCATGAYGGMTVSGTGAQCTTSDPLLGNSCRIEFTIGSYTGAGLGYYFPSGANNYASGFGDLILVAKGQDETDLNNGKIFTGSFIALMQGLHLKRIRVMGWDNENHTNETTWGDQYRTSPHSISWLGGGFGPAIWGGQITGTDIYSISAATNTHLSGWQDGDQLIGYLTTNTPTGITFSGTANNGGKVQLTGVSSTSGLATSQAIYVTGASGTSEANGKQTITAIGSGTVTLNTSYSNAFTGCSNLGCQLGTQTLAVSGVSGTKFILSQSYSAGLSTSLVANTAVTFVYDAVTDTLLAWPGGIYTSIPIEVSVNLANTLNVDLWDNIPILATNSYITSRTTATYSGSGGFPGLNSNLNYNLELSNEIWNGSWQSFYTVQARGLALGWPEGAAESSYIGLRTRQMAGLARTVWNWPNSRLRVVNPALGLAYLACTASFCTLNEDQLQGSLLVGATYPNYCAFVGGSYSGGVCTGDPGYNVSGNRPIDYSAVLSAATNYYQGTWVSASGGAYSSISAYNVGLLSTAVNNYASGNTAAAFAAVAQNVYWGTFDNTTTTYASSVFTPSSTNTYGNGWTIYFNGTPPSSFTQNRAYWVVNSTTGAGGTYQLSDTLNGSVHTFSGSSTTTIGAFGDAGSHIGSGTMADGIYNNQLAFINLIAAEGYNVTYENYEGGFYNQGPSTSDCTAMGVTAPPIGGGSPTAAGCSAQYAAMMTAYLQTSTAYQMAFDAAAQAGGYYANNPYTMPAGTTPSWLVLTQGGNNAWTMCPGTAPNWNCYQVYYAYGAYSLSP